MDESEPITKNGYLSPTNAINKKLSGQNADEFSGKVIEICSGCDKPISDRYIMRVMEHSWHETCLQCAVCRIILTQSCYSRDCKLYCKADYEKLYGAKCTGCLESIPATELVMKALDSIFHLNCFICVECGKQLKKGDQYIIRSGRLFCRPDFEKEIALTQMTILANESVTVSSISQNSPVSSSNNSNGNLQRQDGRRGPKRPRTILTTIQRRAFKASFEVSQKPCRKVRESLAKETGLSVRIVQVWFQNQRAKLKKIQRKQQLQAQHHQQSGSDLNGTQTGDKSSVELSKLSPYSQLASNVSGNLSDSSADSPRYSVPPMQFLSHSPDGSYYSPQRDGYSRREKGMDSESSLQGLEDVLLQSGCSNGDNERCHHNLDSGPICSNPLITPIDKLYSMQTSYFSSNECECVSASN